jgi:hypothetical protein
VLPMTAFRPRSIFSKRIAIYMADTAVAAKILIEAVLAVEWRAARQIPQLPCATTR